VLEVVQKKMTRAEFAYISATSSKSLDLVEESRHLATAFQLAGSPSVIATLWNISDQYSDVIAGKIYDGMVRDGKFDIRLAPRSLSQALRGLRDQLWRESGGKTADPLTWAAFIHIGC